jgi:trigger factor
MAPLRAMQVNVQKLSPVLVEFDVEVEAEKVRTEFDKTFNSVAKGARVKGFRPGKAPRSVLLQMFGARVSADVAQRLVDETFPQAVSQGNVQPVGSPAVERKPLTPDQPFSYKARVEVLPEVSEVKYDGLVAKRPKIEASEEQIAEELEKLRRSLATLEPLSSPRPTEKGDVVTIDYVVEVSGKVVPEAGAKDFQAEIGAGTLLPAIDEALVGKQPGDAAEALVEMPSGHPSAVLRGKRARFKLSVKDVKRRVLPELDDEFAKDAGEHESLADLKQHLKQDVERRLKEQAENTVAEQLVLELVKSNPIPVPGALVEQQMRLTEQEILAQARRSGQGAQRISDELRSRVRNDSEVKVRAGLLMAAIARTEGIKIGEEQIEAGLQELADQTGKNIAKVRAEYRSRQQREMLVGMILENKVLDLIEAKARIEEG